MLSYKGYSGRMEFCRERGEKPDKPCSGEFVLRIPRNLQHKLYLEASRSGKSLNNWLVEVIKDAVD